MKRILQTMVGRGCVYGAARLLPFLLAAAGVAPAAETARFNLPEKAPKARFQVTDRTWPAKVGEASVCLWRDDKLAAISLTVDDNYGPEIEWWKEQAAKYDLKITWFLITGRVSCGTAMWGTWDQYRELRTLGHGLESHTVTHLHVEEPGWGTAAWTYADSRKPGGKKAGELTPAEIARGITWEYAESKAQIEKAVPGCQISAIAYSGGANSKLHDRDAAAKIYRLGRAASGRCNPANATDYLGVIAMSAWDLEPGKASCLSNVLDPKLYRGMYYRGWAVLLTHSAMPVKEKLAATFEFIKKNRGELWVGLFTEVGKYGQERDTATLKVEAAGADRIMFRLTDEMDDSYFNAPLTVKVRIPDGWKDVKAEQNGTAVPAVTVSHEGGRFALVQAVPDAGSVSVKGK